MGTQAGLQITCFACIILSVPFLMKNKELKRKIKDCKYSFVSKAKMPYSLQTAGKASMYRLQAHIASWPAAADEGSPRSILAPRASPHPLLPHRHRAQQSLMSSPPPARDYPDSPPGKPSAQQKQQWVPKEGEHTNYEKLIFPV